MAVSMAAFTTNDSITKVVSSEMNFALLWAMLLGYLVFGDVPDAMMVLGASIIVLSGLYAFYRERIRHRALAAESSGFPPDGL